MIEGKWKLVGGEQDGQELSEADCQGGTLEVVGNQHTVQLPHGCLKGTHTLQTDQSPMAIDASDTEGPYAGQTLLGIFDVKDDVFIVCFADPGKPRPTEFTTQNGQATILHHWARQ